MNASKEVEYIAEIVRLKRELDAMKRSELTKISDLKEYATIENINTLIASYYNKNHTCSYELINSSTSKNKAMNGEVYIFYTPPRLHVTKTIIMD